MRAHSSSARSGLVALSLGCATLVIGACASVLGLEEGILGDPFADQEGGTSPTNIDPLGNADAGCSGAGCPCGEGNACRDSKHALCLDGRCVECSPTDDKCPLGHYCVAATHECALGCRSNDDCVTSAPAAPLCKVERHQCVACLEDSDCPTPNQACTPSGTCADKCQPDAGTAGRCLDPSKTCCDGLCIDTQNDIFSCGGCGAPPCTGESPKCCAGVCKDTLSDTNNCGACGTDCATKVQNASSPSCSTGKCTYAQCRSSFADCDTNKENGCECACGGTEQPCCAGSGDGCNDDRDYCGSDKKCHRCKARGQQCSSDSECCDRDDRCEGYGGSRECRSRGSSSYGGSNGGWH